MHLIGAGIDWGSSNARVWSFDASGTIPRSSRLETSLQDAVDQGFSNRVTKLLEQLRPPPETAIVAFGMIVASGVLSEVSYVTCLSGTVQMLAEPVSACPGNLYILFAFDPNERGQLRWLEDARDVSHAIVTQCRIAPPGPEDARQLTGLAATVKIVAFCHALGAAEVLPTLGRLHGLAVPEAAEWANAAVAPSTCGLGAVAPIPNLSQTQVHIQQRGEHHGN
ncbi:MAG: 2-dehydro-3-deoxygalactonokinase [Roseovarius sp.]|nr:2-dehydro-3-deoxygalactonokinase [Roseovarius sp.]